MNWVLHHKTVFLKRNTFEYLKWKYVDSQQIYNHTLGRYNLPLKYLPTHIFKPQRSVPDEAFSFRGITPSLTPNPIHHWPVYIDTLHPYAGILKMTVVDISRGVGQWKTPPTKTRLNHLPDLLVMLSLLIHNNTYVSRLKQLTHFNVLLDNRPAMNKLVTWPLNFWDKTVEQSKSINQWGTQRFENNSNPTARYILLVGKRKR